MNPIDSCTIFLLNNADNKKIPDLARDILEPKKMAHQKQTTSNNALSLATEIETLIKDTLTNTHQEINLKEKIVPILSPHLNHTPKGLGFSSINTIDQSIFPKSPNIEIIDAELISFQNHGNTPTWLKGFSQIAFTNDENGIKHQKIQKLLNNSCGCILLLNICIPIEDKNHSSYLASTNATFAITFGAGYHLIKETYCVQDFSLKVTLNTIDLSKILSADSKRPQNDAQKSSQKGQSGSIRELGIDSSSEIVKNIYGFVKGDLTKDIWQIGGTDRGVKIKSNEKELKDLPNLCSLLHKKYTTKTKEELSSLINIKKSSTDEANQLTQELLTTINKDISDFKSGNEKEHTVILQVPTIIDYSQFTYFYFDNHSTKNIFNKLDYKAFLKSVTGSISDPEQLKKIHLRLLDSNNDPYRTYSLMRCLFFEIEKEDACFYLSEGSWYKVNKSFINNLEESLESLLTTSLKGEKSLNAYPYLTEHLDTTDKIPKHSEANYNESLAKYLGGHLLDKENITIPDGTAIEPCDVLTYDSNTGTYTFYHIKISKSSSTLSHLFNQGLVSAELLRDKDPNFTEQLNKKLESSNNTIPPFSPNAKIKIVFGVIVENKTDQHSFSQLPLFSKISLQNIARMCNRYQIKVSLVLIEDRSKLSSIKNDLKYPTCSTITKGKEVFLSNREPLRYKNNGNLTTINNHYFKNKKLTGNPKSPNEDKLQISFLWEKVEDVTISFNEKSTTFAKVKKSNDIYLLQEDKEDTYTIKIQDGNQSYDLELSEALKEIDLPNTPINTPSGYCMTTLEDKDIEHPVEIILTINNQKHTLKIETLQNLIKAQIYHPRTK